MISLEDFECNCVETIMLVFFSLPVYVFLGDDHGLIDFVRFMQDEGLTDTGQFAVIAVHETPNDPSRAEDDYFLKGILK